MGNISNGTGAVVRSAINNNLVAYSESQFYDLNYYLNRNTQQIINFDLNADPGVTYTGGTQNTTYYKTGKASRGFTNSAGPQTLEAIWDSNIDLSVFRDGGNSDISDFIIFIVYLGGTVPDSITLGFSASQADYSTKKMEISLNSGFAADQFNYLKIQKSAFAVTGEVDWNSMSHMKLTYSGGNATTCVYYDNLQLVRKYTVELNDFPNPFQREQNGTWISEFNINSGEWYLNMESEELICRNLDPTAHNAGLLGTHPFIDFNISMTTQCLTANKLCGPSWYSDSTKYIKTYIDSDVLYLVANDGAIVITRSTPLSMVNGDNISFGIVKQGTSVTLTVNRNSGTSYVLNLQVDLGINGSLGVVSLADTYQNIKSIGITKLPFAYKAGSAEALADIPYSEIIRLINVGPWLTPIPTFRSMLPDGCLWLDGKSIGDVSSGATALASSDAKRLFCDLWNSLAQTECLVRSALSEEKTFSVNTSTYVITCAGHGYNNGDTIVVSSNGSLPASLSTETLYYIINAATDTFNLSTSSGGGAIDITTTGSGTHKVVKVVRGTTAIDDFNAHKRLNLPDLRGRVLVGADSLGGSSANVVTATEADSLGKKAGEEKHKQEINEMPTHDHYFRGGDNSSGTGPYTGEATDLHNMTFRTSLEGGGQPFNIMQPYMTIHWIIRYL